jgi:hypothetical protein
MPGISKKTQVQLPHEASLYHLKNVSIVQIGLRRGFPVDCLSRATFSGLRKSSSAGDLNDFRFSYPAINIGKAFWRTSSNDALFTFMMLTPQKNYNLHNQNNSGIFITGIII